MPRSSWRSKLMVRTSVTVPFEPTGAAKPQGDRPKSVRSTNPQYQCGSRAIREETEHRFRDALHRPPSSAYSIENTGITGERNPFSHVPRVTPSASQSDSAIWASAPRAEVHSKEAQKMTPWKNYPVETKPPIGFFARPPVTPCQATLEPFARHMFAITRTRSLSTPPLLPHSAKFPRTGSSIITHLQTCPRVDNAQSIPYS